jgi:hypothetical protein
MRIAAEGVGSSAGNASSTEVEWTEECEELFIMTRFLHRASLNDPLITILYFFFTFFTSFAYFYLRFCASCCNLMPVCVLPKLARRVHSAEKFCNLNEEIA